MKKNISSENFINKDIQEVSSLFDCKLESNLLNKNVYDIDLKEERSFHNFYYQYISIIIDGESKITSFSIKFQKIIDVVFYNSFVENYGNPNKIFKEKEKKLISESKIKVDKSKTFQQKLRQYASTLVESSFEDNPKFILWDKENHQIKILMDYGNGISVITFSKL